LSLEGNDRVPKKFRVQDLSVTKPTVREAITSSPKNLEIGNLSWLDGYSGQTVEELLALEGRYRIDSLVLAFEEAIRRKRSARHALTDEERIILAIEALEREVNNGGYVQFFTNSSREFAPTIVDSLRRIGCKKTASITQKTEALDAAMASEVEQRLAKLNQCDEAYYENAEPIAEQLFAFIKRNKAGISL
jgi:Domain of unknown function (DUF4375)